MEVNWLFFATIVIFTYLLFAVVIPFGWALGYSCKWNIWFKNVSKLDEEREEESKNKKEKHFHNLNDNGTHKKQ